MPKKPPKFVVQKFDFTERFRGKTKVDSGCEPEKPSKPSRPMKALRL